MIDRFINLDLYYNNLVNESVAKYDSAYVEYNDVLIEFKNVFRPLMLCADSSILKESHPMVFTDLNNTSTVNFTIESKKSQTGANNHFSGCVSFQDGSNIKVNVMYGTTEELECQFTSGSGNQISIGFSDIAFDVIQPLVDAIKSLSKESIDRLSLIKGSQNLLSMTSADYKLPSLIQSIAFKKLLLDFFEGGYAADKVRDSRHLTNLLSALETPLDLSMRDFLGSLTRIDESKSILSRLFNDELNHDILPNSLLDHMASFVECNNAAGNGVNVLSICSTLQILAHRFVELDFNQKISFCTKAAQHPSFSVEILNANSVFYNFILKHSDEIKECLDCISLANSFDYEITALSMNEEATEHTGSKIILNNSI